MRLVLPLLLLAAVVAGILPTDLSVVEELGKLKGKQMAAMRRRLNDIRKHVRDELKKMPKISGAEQALVDDVIKKAKGRSRDKIREGGDRVSDVNEKLKVAGNFFQGDVVLEEEQIDNLFPDLVGAVSSATSGLIGALGLTKRKRQAYRDSNYPATTWGSTFYYYFDVSVAGTHTETVARLAMQLWQNNTCINFVESRTAAHRVRYFSGGGCYSNVGMTRLAEQDISLGQYCDSVGTAAHEIGHALGFFHEQSRFDRDNSIIVQTQNTEPDWVDQFAKQTSATNYNYGMAYDYGSIMHYGGTSASSNGEETMVARKWNYQDTMGSDMVSFRDISAMNEHYNCKSRCSSSSLTVCSNGGFPHPRDCSRCLCPSGFAGPYCTQRTSGCGETLTATATPQNFTGKVGTVTNSIKDLFETCTFHITAPAGRRIRATLAAYGGGACAEGCVYGGVEVKNGPASLTGPRFCCRADAGVALISDGSLMPIIGYTRYNQPGFIITYVVV